MKNTITTITTTIKQTLVALEGADNSSKALFNDSVIYLKSVSTLDAGVSALKNVISEQVTLGNYTNYYKNKLNSIIKYSVIACNSKLAIDTNLLHWYNVEKALKLMEHLLENYTADVTTIKNLLNGLKGKAKDKFTTRTDKNKYNELYSAKLAELYKEYKLEDDEDTKGVKIETLFKSMSLAAQKALIAKLSKGLSETKE
jgi:tRNA U38,U39,U40 pseudouridine synthase TruA